MTEEKKAYQHESEHAGFGSASESHETEHRDTARPAGEHRNEIDPEERNSEQPIGPRTHQDTRIASKDGTGEA